MMSYLELPGGATLAYRRREGCTPGVMFLGGFMSDMSGRKALALEAYCRDNRRAFVAFDYRGHGLSSGRLEELGVDSWIEDSLMVLDTLTDGAQILVGSFDPVSATQTPAYRRSVGFGCGAGFHRCND
jgi:pimeloyl-ACP methyl ester carboxylesterase